MWRESPRCSKSADLIFPTSALVPNQTTTKTKRSVAVFLFPLWFFAVFSLTYAWIPSVCFISLLRVLLRVLLFRIISFVCFVLFLFRWSNFFLLFFFLPYFAEVHFSPPGFALYLSSHWEAHRKSLFVLLNIHTVLTGHCCTLAVPGPGENRVSVYLGAVQSSQNVCVEHDVPAEWRCFSERSDRRLHFSLSLFLFIYF